MVLRTQESVSGFVASDPDLSFTARGEARFHARFGQDHFRRESDGSFTRLESTFHDLVAYRAAAERAFARFRKGDHFVAEGYLHPYSFLRDGQTVSGEEFVAKKLGHDASRTEYTVDRPVQPVVPRSASSAPDVDAPVRAPADGPHPAGVPSSSQVAL
jgi:single-strand DNA-binding protein